MYVSSNATLIGNNWRITSPPHRDQLSISRGGCLNFEELRGFIWYLGFKELWHHDEAIFVYGSA